MARVKAVSETRTETATPDGRTIIAREYNALTPHPHPSQGGRLVPTRGVNKLLVLSLDRPDTEDGVELYECDACGKIDASALSVRGHVSSHNPAKNAPDYAEATIRTVIETVTKYREAKVRGYAEHTAAELNSLGVKTIKGASWTAGAVSNMYGRYKDDPRFRRRRTVARRSQTGDAEKRKTLREVSPKRTVTSPVSPQSPLADITDADHPVVQKLAELAAGIGDMALRLAKVTQELAALPIGEDVSADLREKAAKYDQLLGILK